MTSPAIPPVSPDSARLRVSSLTPEPWPLISPLLQGSRAGPATCRRYAAVAMVTASTSLLISIKTAKPVDVARPPPGLHSHPMHYADYKQP